MRRSLWRLDRRNLRSIAIKAGLSVAWMINRISSSRL